MILIFTPNGVDLNSFPYEVWRKLSREVLLDDRTELFKSGDSERRICFSQCDLSLSVSGKRGSVQSGADCCGGRK